MSHLNEFDENLLGLLQSKPNEILPFFETAAKDALTMLLTQQNEETVNLYIYIKYFHEEYFVVIYYYCCDV